MNSDAQNIASSYSIGRSGVAGSVTAPPSKSLSIRALIAAALAEGASTISNLSDCDDVLSLLKILEESGIKTEQTLMESGSRAIKIIGGGNFTSRLNQINCGESGLLLRILSMLAALKADRTTMDAGGSLLRRTSESLGDAIEQLGGSFSSLGGYPPFTVGGPISAGNAIIDGSEGSQVLSGLLYALPLLNGDSSIEVSGLKSKPYIDMTRDLLTKFGIISENDNYERFEISGRQKYKASDYTIEGDWSGAAFLLVAGAIAGDIRVSGLNADSLQADRAIIDALSAAGADLEITSDSLRVGQAKLSAFDFDASDCPDLIPALIPMACVCEGESVIYGASRLINKESDRAEALLREFNRLGADITLAGDKIFVRGSKLKGGEADSHSDHRIAMALAVAGLVSDGEININNINCIAKSYPGFIRDLEQLRGQR